MSRLLANRLREEARRQPADLAALLEVAADRLEQYEEEAVATRDSVTEALLEAQRRDLEAAHAVQREPVGRVKTVGGYPDESEHTVEWLCKYKDLKDGDLLYTAQQPAEQQQPEPEPDVAGLVQQHHRDSAELRRLCQARDQQRDGRLAALERAAKAEADVTALVEALEAIWDLTAHKGIRTAIQVGKALGCIATMCDAALAAHRNRVR